VKDNHINRRTFHHLTAAAMGGLVAGGMTGCGKKDGEKDDPSAKADPHADKEKHICRGLNTCKGQGASGENDCAGAGNCATVEHHSCAGDNKCKGQGGCGEKPGMNECAGKGKCGVPLKGNMWKKARQQFEERMKEKGKKVLPAPPPKKG